MEIASCCVVQLKQYFFRNFSTSLWHSLCLMRLVLRNLEWTQARSFPSRLPSFSGALSTLPYLLLLALATATSHQAFAGRHCVVMVLFPYQISQCMHHSHILPLDIRGRFPLFQQRRKKVHAKEFSGSLNIAKENSSR